MAATTGPPEDGGGAGPTTDATPESSDSATTKSLDRDPIANRRQEGVGSQQVSWWSVHEFVAAVLNQVNDWPTLGTPAWCSLSHEDPRKWAAVLDGGQHHALRLELNQEAGADASKDIAGSVDWSRLSREIQQRNAFYAERPWLRRVPS
ncbi:hypothetical protein MSIMFI_03798 [Mycobacterium simulans]|uniref:DUF2742 domain-containing protein n=1 Tax=Mycobacterium simulans TaxID=627089 RepID=UPI00174DB90F|nr:DUF2742 domain-containing protein [Mycobacterium simulans]SON62273.1 hypothetical protein MSIMFI_03798 [Mycobacterium simulans]